METFDKLVSDMSLPMFFDAWSKSILSEMDEQPIKRFGSSVIYLSMKNTASINKNVTFSTPAQPVVHEQTSRKSGLCKIDVSAINKRSYGKGEIGSRRVFNLKKGKVLDEIVFAATILLPEVRTKAIVVVTEAI